MPQSVCINKNQGQYVQNMANQIIKQWLGHFVKHKPWNGEKCSTYRLTIYKKLEETILKKATFLCRITFSTSTSTYVWQQVQNKNANSHFNIRHNRLELGILSVSSSHVSYMVEVFEFEMQLRDKLSFYFLQFYYLIEAHEMNIRVQ